MDGTLKIIPKERIAFLCIATNLPLNFSYINFKLAYSVLALRVTKICRPSCTLIFTMSCVIHISMHRKYNGYFGKYNKQVQWGQ